MKVPRSRPVERASKARPNSRNDALSVIEPRLRELKASGTTSYLAGLTYATHQVGSLQLEFVEVPGSRATYVMVSEGRKRLFTGYLDAEPPGKHLGGKVRVVLWERANWEWRLLGLGE